MQHENALTAAKKGTGLAVDFAGTWTNELGSTAHFKQDGSSLSGSYESAVSSGGTKTTGDLVGHVDGDLVAFTVHWREFQAITSWVGQLVPKAAAGTQDAKAKMKTLWQMTKQVAEGDEWASINAGSDLFTRA